MTNTLTNFLLSEGIEHQEYAILGVVEGIEQKTPSTKRMKYIVADSMGRIDCIHFSKTVIDDVEIGTEVLIQGKLSFYKYTNNMTGEDCIYKSLTFEKENLSIQPSEAKPATVQTELPLPIENETKVHITTKDADLISEIVGVLKAAIEDLLILKESKQDEN